jgi:hypothetical protein
MGTELVPETLYSNELTRLCAREDYIESCRRESFKTYNKVIVFKHFNYKTILIKVAVGSFRTWQAFQNIMVNCTNKHLMFSSVAGE